MGSDGGEDVCSCIMRVPNICPVRVLAGLGVGVCVGDVVSLCISTCIYRHAVLEPRPPS